VKDDAMAASELEYLARETQLPFASERDGVVTATLEEIRYAETLRTRLRDTLLRRSTAASAAWCVGAD
jgi:hypothetical protein